MNKTNNLNETELEVMKRTLFLNRREVPFLEVSDYIMRGDRIEYVKLRNAMVEIGFDGADVDKDHLVRSFKDEVDGRMYRDIEWAYSFSHKNT